MSFDLHSHILPGVDDGAKDIDESLGILGLMKENGITEVIATPHFYPFQANLEDFCESAEKAYKLLQEKINGTDLPKVYLGCEMLYYKGIGNSESLDDLCLQKSNYLLLEFTDADINDACLKDLTDLQEKEKIMPIIAHVERYFKAKNFKKFLKFVADNKIPVQVNASSVLLSAYRRVIKNILNNEELFVVVGTDAHSVTDRPPQLKEAMEKIAKKYGETCVLKLNSNNEKIRSMILGDNR